MKSKKWIFVTGLVVALVALLAVVPAVLAQGPGGGRGSGPGEGYMGRGYGNRGHMGYGVGRGVGPGNSMMATVAEAVGLTQADLIAELQSGKTVADVAEEAGVTLETLVSSVIAERATWLAERVASGQLTQAQADFMLANMSANLTAHLSEAWTPGGYGAGNGMRHGGGYGMGFADEDGDGICDHSGTGAASMFQRGGRWGSK